MLAAGAALACSRPVAASESASNDDALDEALRLIHGAEPMSKQGLSTHAPMVAEALCALGFSDRAVAWVAGYRGPLIEVPRPSRKIDPARWRDALGPRLDASSWEGALARWGDWVAYFTAELGAAPWRDVLDTWCARLAPGLSAAATHGAIRTAHAARALGRRETPERRAELARGLAYWAAAYEELPARPAAGAAAASYADALARVPLCWERSHAAPTGNIVNGLRAAGSLDGFAAARDLAPPPADAGAALSALSATFAGVYLRHGARHHPIAFVHAVTGPCALRRIAPFVKSATARAAVPYAWQAAAGIYAAYARRDDAERAGEPQPRLGRTELAARAVDNGADHAIKFTEVLLAEHALRPDPVYLAAAEDAVARL